MPMIKYLNVRKMIGANFPDIAWVIGVSSLVRPLPIERQTLVLDYPFMLLLMGLLVYFGSRNSKIERRQGGKLFAIYNPLPGPYVFSVCLGGDDC